MVRPVTVGKFSSSTAQRLVKCHGSPYGLYEFVMMCNSHDHTEYLNVRCAHAYVFVRRPWCIHSNVINNT